MDGIPKRPRLHSALIVVAMTLWLALVGMGAAATDAWDFRAGAHGAAEPKKGRGFEVILVAHPDCPCTVASLHSLRDLMVRAEGNLRATVCLIDTGSRDSTRTVRAAFDVPDANVKWITFAEAARYGALTSGHTTLYENGKPVYSGGLTLARGIEGPSAGQVAIEAALRHERFVPRAPVFGCPLNARESS